MDLMKNNLFIYLTTASTRIEYINLREYCLNITLLCTNSGNYLYINPNNPITISTGLVPVDNSMIGGEVTNKVPPCINGRNKCASHYDDFCCGSSKMYSPKQNMDKDRIYSKYSA